MRRKFSDLGAWCLRRGVVFPAIGFFATGLGAARARREVVVEKRRVVGMAGAETRENSPLKPSRETMIDIVV